MLQYSEKPSPDSNAGDLSGLYTQKGANYDKSSPPATAYVEDYVQEFRTRFDRWIRRISGVEASQRCWIPDNPVGLTTVERTRLTNRD
jgi:hypothetical protein